MTKPLSREKLLERLDGLYKNRSAYCNSEVFSLEKAAWNTRAKA